MCSAVKRASEIASLDDWDNFAKNTKMKKGQLNKIRQFIT